MLPKTPKQNERFGRLIFVEARGSRRNRRGIAARIALFACDCGRQVVRDLNSVRCGHTRSCGCLLDNFRVGPRSHGESTSKLWGKGGSPEWRSWKAMRNRCEQPRVSGYARYGGRGIRICEQWRRSFSAFLRDLGRKPGPEYTLERLDPDGNYEPKNCRWATRDQQRRTTRMGIARELERCRRLLIRIAKSRSVAPRLRRLAARLGEVL